MKNRILALFAVLLLLCPMAAGAENVSCHEMLNGILRFKASQSGAAHAADWAADHLPDLMGRGGEWYAIGLRQLGGYDLSASRAALEAYVETANVRAAATRQKLSLALLALDSTHPFISATMQDAMGKQGVMSWSWGLQLIHNGCASPVCTADEAVKTLLEMRREDGGWAVMGSVSDPDVTAMVLQALAPLREDPDVASAVSGAVELLAELQLPHGGFASCGVKNAESTAQVIIALCALGIDPSDERFVRDGATLPETLAAFRLADGSFSHERGGAYHESATAQAFLACAACVRMEAGRGNLFLLDGDAQPAASGARLGCRPLAAMIIGGAALVACLVLLLIGKRHWKNFLAVLVLAIALIGLVYAVDIQSAEDYYAAAPAKEDAVGTVTLSIRCDRAAGRADHIPADGVLLADTVLPIAQGDTVYTVLTDAARAYGLHMEAGGASGLIYIHGIGNIYEFDYGDLSGWLYSVNGETFSVGCDQYVLHDGDRVEWHYTLALGKDIP